MQIDEGDCTNSVCQAVSAGPTQQPFRNSVSATSTFARSACLIAGQFFSLRTSVFHE